MPALSLPPEAATLADAVARSVRDGVAAGELVPDRTYSVYQLAELFGVSRSPVREGLLRLAEAGLVEIIRNREMLNEILVKHNAPRVVPMLGHLGGIHPARH